MKNNFQKLLRGILLTSMAALVNTHGAEALPNYSLAGSDNDDAEIEKGERDNSKKLLLTIYDDF